MVCGADWDAGRLSAMLTHDLKNAIEALSVIALIPLLLGMFGIFSDLLEAF